MSGSLLGVGNGYAIDPLTGKLIPAPGQPVSPSPAAPPAPTQPSDWRDTMTTPVWKLLQGGALGRGVDALRGWAAGADPCVLAV